MAKCLSGSDSHGGIYSIHSLDGCALAYLARLGADPVGQWPLSLPSILDELTSLKITGNYTSVAG